jgi:hypothetical protein
MSDQANHESLKDIVLQPILHGMGIRIRGYGYGTTGKRHFLKIDLLGYGEYMRKYIKKRIVLRIPRGIKISDPPGAQPSYVSLLNRLMGQSVNISSPI